MGKRIDRKVRAVLRRVFLVTVLIAGQAAAASSAGGLADGKIGRAHV